MKTHTIEGQRMLDRVGGLLGTVGVVVRASHEDFDGTGYPDGLAGEQIPLAARIVSACDAFNAMTTRAPIARRCRSRPRWPSCAAARAPNSTRMWSRRCWS